MKKGKYFISIGITAVAFVLIAASCNNMSKEKLIADLIETDLAFSEMSGDKGVKRASLDYIDTAEIALNKDQMLIDSKNSVIEHFRNYSDSGFVLSWKPLGANIVSSGNIGYTYGIYKIESIDTVSKGTYVALWKKDKNGRWKLVLDPGNEGLVQID